jgi:hypothetical protein
MSVTSHETTPIPADIKAREHLPLGLQEFIDYTNWKGTKLNVAGSDEMEGFSGAVPAHFKSSTVALMPNGWLPAGFIPPSVDILADQTLLGQLQEKFPQGVPDESHPAGFLDLIKFDINSINTSFAALEANPLSVPDKGAMKGVILDTIKRIKAVLPQADIAPKGLQALEALFTVANNSSERRETESQFLADVCPALHAPIKSKHRMKVTQFVTEWAMIHGVTPTSLAFTACISVIWSNDEFNPARAILSPKKGYTTLDGLVALDALRKLELLMLTSAALGVGGLALMCGNKDLIHFWLALAPKNISHNGSVLKWELRLTGALFQEMKPSDYAEVQELFSAAAARETDEPIEEIQPMNEPTVAFKFDRKIDSRLEQKSAKARIMNLIKRAK